jgi:hypothetical protein
MLIQMPQPEMSHGFEAQKRVDFWNRMTAKYAEYNLVLGRRGGGEDHGNGKEDGEDHQEENGNGTSSSTLMGLSKNAIGLALLLLLFLIGQFTAFLL